MACPICDRTMAGLVDAPIGQRKFHCSYCGTLKLESGDVETIYVPYLIRNPEEIPNAVLPDYYTKRTTRQQNQG